MNNCCTIINVYGEPGNVQYICGRMVPIFEPSSCDYYEESANEADVCKYCIFGSTCDCDRAIKDASANRKLARL